MLWKASALDAQCVFHFSVPTMRRWWRLLALPSCFDNGAFSHWKKATRDGQEWHEKWDWQEYYDWLESRLFHPGRWAVIPDMPGAPSQLNDALINDWPFGQKGAPLWHMDGPLDRLLRLCDKFDRVCLGWTGKGKGIDCPAYRERMAEVDQALGNRWPEIHMMRGVAVAFDYPFGSADSTSLAQNGWRYDTKFDFGDKWRGRRDYANRLERKGICEGLRGYSDRPQRPQSAPITRPASDRPSDQFRLW